MNRMTRRIAGAVVGAAGLVLAQGASAVVMTYNSTDVPVAIPEGGGTSGPADSVLDIGDTGSINDVNVFLSLTHTFDGDLVISIESPTGTTVRLSNRIGGSGDNYTNTVFDDEAAVSIAAGSGPFTGTFIPEGSLAAFDSEDLFGTWILHIDDRAGLGNL